MDNVNIELIAVIFMTAMFAHLITERNGKWYVRTDSGIIKEFTSHTSVHIIRRQYTSVYISTHQCI